MRNLELLAPARNKEIGIAAIDCGADAVYLAGPAFGARQAAGNSIGDIRELCEYAHRFGARVFVTLNTILYDSELDEAFSLARSLQDAGVDALIVQDMALAAYESSHPEKLSIPLHASTQCSIRTVEEARRFDALGFSRIVLERELPFSRVREICSAVSCEVEAFVHGALCVCYSGQCYLSRMLTSRSANRGECIQACRSRYDLVDSQGQLIVCPKKPSKGAQGDYTRSQAPLAQNRTLLSLRDLCLLERLPEMARGGVISFKIEGRLKNISYVRNIVAAYSRALDKIVADSPDEFSRASFGQVSYAFTPNPVKSFNRGFTEIFFDAKREGQWACLDAGKALGEAVGVVKEVSRGKNGGMRIVLQGGSSAGSDKKKHNGGFEKRGERVQNSLPDLHNGDGFAFIGPDGTETGFRADVCDGTVIQCREVQGLRPGMQLYRNLDTAFEKEVEKGGLRRIGVQLGVQIENPEGGRYRIRVQGQSEDGRRAQEEVEIESEPARNQERMLEGVRNQLSKNSGVYSFRLSEEINFTGSLPMISSSLLNGLRRSLADDLDSMQCISKPLRKSPLKGELPQELKFPPHITYKSDVANSLAADFYRRCGAEAIEPAYELSGEALPAGFAPRADWSETERGAETCGGRSEDKRPKELMRSKYCILHELGFCRKTPAYNALCNANSLKEGLFLRNNARLLRLGFDCAACEMTITE